MNVFIKAALIRALRTVAQTALAAIGTTALITEVNWGVVASTAGLAGVISLLMSLGGLPETTDTGTITRDDEDRSDATTADKDSQEEGTKKEDK